MRRQLALAASLTAFAFSPLALAVTHQELAEYWGPRVYHDTNDAYGYNAEYITKVDYDGNWIGTDNWENLPYYGTPAHLYYNVVETSTHWFITYNAFHPRDDGPIGDQHENDFEGGLLAVRKDGSTYGQLQVMETLAHDQIYQYTNDLNIVNGSDNKDGPILSVGGKPTVYIQANGFSGDGNGHGWKAWDGTGAPGGDGIVYYNGGTADQPDGGDGNWTRVFSYQLLSMSELWDKRYQMPDPFGEWGALHGDTHGTNKAKMPWRWDDGDDGPVYDGAMWSDPALLIDTHLSGLGSFSRNYTVNDVANFKATITGATSTYNSDPFGGKSDIYVNVIVGGRQFWGEDQWKRNDATSGTNYSVVMGGANARFTGYDGSTSSIWIAKPITSTVTLEVWDSDTDGDDFMGSISFTCTAGQTQSGTNQSTSNGKAKLTYSVQCLR